MEMFPGICGRDIAVPPKARALLERFDERSEHYDVMPSPEDIP